MRRMFLLFLALFASGCFLERTVIGASDAPDADAPQGMDGGPSDAGSSTEDAGLDNGDDDAGMSPTDAGPTPTDAGPTPTDAGPTPTDAGHDAGCSPTDTRCEGQTAYVCEGGELTRETCPTDQFCEHAAGEHPDCTDDRCTANATRCTDPARAQETCAADGSGWEAPVPCPRGCTSNECRDATSCSLTLVAEVGPSAMWHQYNLCGAGDDALHADDGDWGCFDNYSSDGEDVILRLNIADDGKHCVVVRDVPGSESVHSTVYLRSQCADQGTQINCDTDRDNGGDSSFEEDLNAGDYFIVVDSYDYGRGGGHHGCGTVEVRVTSGGCP